MLTLERYIPLDSAQIINEDAKAEVYTYENAGPCAIGYSGKRKKPDFQYRFKTPEQRDVHIATYFKGKIDGITAKEVYKQEKKERDAKEFATLEIGDIFHCGWGYEQTQCDFYQLIELKGKTGTFRPINGETTKEISWGSENMKAVPNSFCGEPFTKRLSGSNFKISSFQYVSKVQDINKSFYHSWYA